ncbi:MAG: ATP-dependent Clp protease proteolytic subunit [Ardenticatenia bacterium]|nr:ATP-dependent Clp protease proteolytic subunit [Ardenticatenia bacterium]
MWRPEWRLLSIAGALVSLLLLTFTALPVHAEQEPASGEVLVLTASGPVTPALKSYLERGLEEAEASGAQLVVLRLDTPGGSVGIMSEVVKVIDNASVPVAVYVWPSGGRAASAGTFIVLAAHSRRHGPQNHPRRGLARGCRRARDSRDPQPQAHQ